MNLATKANYLPPSSGRTLKRSPDIVAQKLGEDTVLVHMVTNQIYTLNWTATRLWELLERISSPQALYAQLLEEFEVDPEFLAREVDTMLQELVAAGILVDYSAD